MNFLRFLKTSISALPQAIVNGSVYFKKSTQALSLDLDGERYRVNPPADWEETNTESPAYIANKPDIGTAAAFDLAENMQDTDNIPNVGQVSTAIEIAKTQIANMVGTPNKSSTKANMVDPSKIYIYTGSEQGMTFGDWYYFDDVQLDWVDGGVYNSVAVSTDTTLTMPNMAADAEEVGDRLTSMLSTINSTAATKGDTVEFSANGALSLKSGNTTLSSATIPDGAIARAKVAPAFEATLAKADSAMQPSVYDPEGHGTGQTPVDPYSYTEDLVDDAKNATQNTDTYTVDSTAYTGITAAIEGALTKSKAFTNNRFNNYEPYTIQIVPTLPSTGENFVIYMIPKNNGTFEKWWYVRNSNGQMQWDVFGGSSTLVVSTLPASGDSEADYILNNADGCFYYKWIDNEWKIVAGSVASVVEELPQTGNEFTDYYVENTSGDAYLHYRYIDGDFVPVGSDAYSKTQVDNMLSAISGRIGAVETSVSGLSTSLGNLQQTVNNLDTEGYQYYATYGTTEIDGVSTENVFQLHQMKGGQEEVTSQFVIQGGGGGGASTATDLRVDRVTASPLVITPTDKAILDYTFSSTDSSGGKVSGSYTWKLDGTIIGSGTCSDGLNSFDVTDYCIIGSRRFILNVTDEGGSTAMRSFTVQMVDVRIESDYNDRYTVEMSKKASVTYTPYGSVSKTVHFKLDGVEDTITTTSSGIPQTYDISPQTYGSHLLEFWVTAEINHNPIETAHIFKDIIWYDADLHNDPVIGCAFRYDYRGKVEARQYDTTQIVYNVYDPSTNFPVVNRYVDGVLVSVDTLQQPQGVWNYKSDDVGDHTLILECGNTQVTIIMTITELGIDVSPVTGGLEIDFNPSGITNNSANRIWSNDYYHMAVSNNFDWANGGYKFDENGDDYFLIKAGTYITFDYEMFSGGIERNPSVHGAEMKIVFMIENVQNVNGVWLTNAETVENTVNDQTVITNMGIQMGVHDGWLKTNNARNASDGDDENGVAATNTYLYMPYSEEDIIEMDINIDTIDPEDSTAKAFVMAYEDGVPSKAFVYDNSHRFYQYTPQILTIGSDVCDVRIYRLKIYSVSLTTNQIMRNFIADARNSVTMLERYDRNAIYYNTETEEYSPYSDRGTLSPERLAPKIPNVKVLMLDTDHFTTSKKTFVKSTLRCIHAPGGTIYPGDPYYDNWLFENGWHSGQGTTSDNYGNAGRNVDFLFNCDGTHKPSDKIKEPEADYISKLTLGYNTENAHVEFCDDWKGVTAKVGLTRTSIPNNFFNLKVNIASSENVNNALLQKRFSDFLPYTSPAKARDSRIKNDMEFVPAVLFLRENNPDISTHNEFLDTNWHFYALGNLGDSKKTDYTRSYDPEDMNEFTIEISDNTKNNATFQTGVYLDGNGHRQIEAFTTSIVVNDDNEEEEVAQSIAKPSAYVYPITLAEWNNENNMRRWTLYNEGFDGDHSFEPRYACCGDYRDGKLVNDYSGHGKAQVKTNEGVWRAFYRWVITSTDAEFRSEFDQWCVRSVMEFYYAFTHYYTMTDSRAKNSFYHFAKTGVFREISHPVPELLHVYCELSDNEYVPTEDTEINNLKTYYSEYAFDLWDYDNDTALGIKCQCQV